MINLHASGGSRMIRAAAEALRGTAAEVGVEPPILLGVTLLTSLSQQELETELNVSLGVDGHRGDLTARKAAQALAALRDISEVGQAEVDEVIDMVLSHRVKAPVAGTRPNLALTARGGA